MELVVENSGCFECGEELVYQQEDSLKKCMICAKEFRSNVACPNNHFVCDSCHSLSAAGLVEAYCIGTESRNPVKILNQLMKNKAVKMHGPEHHFIVPAALLAAYYNTINKPEEKARALKIAIDRGSKIPGGFCGTHGSCGAGMGTGIYVSIVTGSTPLAREEWKLSNLMTATSLHQIALGGGPRCCKRDSFIAIDEAVTFTKDVFKVELEMTEQIKCGFHKRNRQCLMSACSYYPIKEDAKPV